MSRRIVRTRARKTLLNPEILLQEPERPPRNENPPPRTAARAPETRRNLSPPLGHGHGESGQCCGAQRDARIGDFGGVDQGGGLDQPPSLHEVLGRVNGEDREQPLAR